MLQNNDGRVGGVSVWSNVGDAGGLGGTRPPRLAADERWRQVVGAGTQGWKESHFFYQPRH